MNSEINEIYWRGIYERSEKVRNLNECNTPKFRKKKDHKITRLKKQPHHESRLNNIIDIIGG